MERKKGFKVCFEACSQPQTAFDVDRGQTVPVSREQGKGSRKDRQQRDSELSLGRKRIFQGQGAGGWGEVGGSPAGQSFPHHNSQRKQRRLKVKHLPAMQETQV